MREIFPGVLHWSVFYEAIGLDVSSYYVEPVGLLIDPMLPAEAWTPSRGAPSPAGCPHQRAAPPARPALRRSLRLPHPHLTRGRPRIGGALKTEEYRPDGDAPGARALKIGVLAPDELHCTSRSPSRRSRSPTPSTPSRGPPDDGGFGDDVLAAIPDDAEAMERLPDEQRGQEVQLALIAGNAPQDARLIGYRCVA